MQYQSQITDYLPYQTELLPRFDGGTGRQIDPPRSLQMEARQWVAPLGFAPELWGAAQ